MPDSRPLVSILTPSFNQAQWLGDNLLSVANQTYLYIEHIVMDGGSTDGSVDVLREQAGPHVRWWSEPDRGQSHALNKAFAESNGEIIGWINSDDAYADRRAVASAVSALTNDPRLDVVYGHSILVNGSNEVLQLLWAPPFLRALTEFITPYFQPAVFMRRTSLPVPLVDESLNFVMDFDLWATLWESSTFKRINTVVGLERHQAGRKVMQSAYLDERRSYDAGRGKNRRSLQATIVQRLAASSFRVRSVGMNLTAPGAIDPAIDLVWPPASERVYRQLFTRRSRMPTTSSGPGPTKSVTTRS